MTTIEALTEVAVPSRRARRRPSSMVLWVGRVAGGLAVAFLLMDAVGKLIQPVPVVEGTVRIGFPATLLPALGLMQLALLALYLVPGTAVLGALLWNGYLGGAVAGDGSARASSMRDGSSGPAASHQAWSWDFTYCGASAITRVSSRRLHG